MSTKEAAKVFTKVVAAAEQLNAVWKADPEKAGTSDAGVAALMALQVTLPEAKRAVEVLGKRFP